MNDPTGAELDRPSNDKARAALALLKTRISPDWDQLAARAARLVPDKVVWQLFENAVDGLGVALCLHRVARRYRDRLTIAAPELDAFIEGALRVRRTRASRDPWLTITFDDGYEDACHYVESRARRFPEVEFLLFVCPTKAERRVGFRLDLDDPDEPTPRRIDSENERADLRSVVRFADCRLATVEDCRRVQRIGNVSVGNHTNCHFSARALPLAQSATEIRRSSADFRRLFGKEEHFAFPFGTPELDFDDRHISLLRTTGDFVIWSTARRPYLTDHRHPGAVLPRFPVDGTWSATQLAFWIALLSAKARFRDGGMSPLYPVPAPAARGGGQPHAISPSVGEAMGRSARFRRHEISVLAEDGALRDGLDACPTSPHASSARSPFFDAFR